MAEYRRPGHGAGRSLEDEQWAAARERAREQVREAFAGSEEAPLRRCPRCGREERTRWEDCPHCGWSYFRPPPRFSQRTKRIAAAIALVGIAAGLTQLIPALVRTARHEKARTRTENSRLVAAEVKRLQREQRPRHGSAPELKPGAATHAPAVLRARAGLVAFVEAAITRDARRRIARGELTGPVRETRCGPLEQVNRGQRPILDHRVLTKPIGRYDCTVIKSDIVQDGEIVGKFGYPFVAALDFRTFTFTFCKNNPAQGERGVGLAHVRLARSCLAARGRPFANGYLVVPDPPLDPPPP